MRKAITVVIRVAMEVPTGWSINNIDAYIRQHLTANCVKKFLEIEVETKQWAGAECPSTLPDEVKRALRRTRLVYCGIPRRTLALWRLSDPRPTPIHFWDGTIDHKRVALIAAREAK